MRIFTALTYYRPHYSGLTVYAERLARGLVQRGHSVTVLTSRFKRDLPSQETMEGVEVIRPDVLLRLSKGVIMPAMPGMAWKLAQQADVIHLHAPQMDAAYISLFGRMLGKPVVLTYHCDLHLPAGPVHALANLGSTLANHIAARYADVIVQNTRDYAEHSSFLRHYLDKVTPVNPPVELAPASPADIDAFRKKADIQPGERIIGMAARLATEKGVEYLVEAMPAVLQEFPQARVFFMGQYHKVLGEQAYARKLAPLIKNLGHHWTFLGNISPVELTSFYRSCEVTVLPSINSTESFGIVQIESMCCGTPVIASDLPGVRQPVLSTGMGRIVPVANADALANAILDVLRHPNTYHSDFNQIGYDYSTEAVAARYEDLFERLVAVQPAPNRPLRERSSQ